MINLKDKFKELGITFMLPFAGALISLVSGAFLIIFIQDGENFRADLKLRVREQVNIITSVREVFAEKQDIINNDSKGHYEFKHLNPAQAANLFIDKTNFANKIQVKQTSNLFRRAEDAPDAWEVLALRNFEKNPQAKEFDGWIKNPNPEYRYAVPLFIEKECLDCHGEPKGDRDITGHLKEGYKLGQLRGIISVKVPLDSYYVFRNKRILLFTGLMLGVIGLSVLAGLRMVKSLQQVANTDKLTNLSNRNLFNSKLKNEISLSLKQRTSLALIMFDIDHFKKVNDTYGHLVGDEVLKEIANLAKGCLRGNDFLIRFGGEEFLILAPHTGQKGATVLAERLRQKVADNIFRAGETTFKITISLGIMTTEDIEDIEDYNEEVPLDELLIARADQALYYAKNNGRNRVATYSECK